MANILSIRYSSSSKEATGNKNAEIAKEDKVGYPILM